MKSTDFNGAIGNAIVYLQKRYPFWSLLLHKATFEPDESIPTACVNARGRVRINPTFFAGLPIESQAFLLGHEVGHPAFGFFWRAVGHDLETANIAHDHVLNWALHLDFVGPDLATKPESVMTDAELALSAERGTLKSISRPVSWFIPGGCLSEELGPLSYEEVYHRLRRDGADSAATPGGIGSDVEDLLDGELTPEESKELETSWRVHVLRAVEGARAMGKLPAHIELLAGDIAKPRVKWSHRLVASAKAGVAVYRLDHSRPSRRPPIGDFISPREVTRTFDVAVAIDTSGSMLGSPLENSVTEAAGLIRAAGGRIRFYSCDAEVGSFGFVRHPREFNLVGGGGTSFVPVFEALKQKPPHTLVYFTDLEGSFPDHSPRFKTIWVVPEGNRTTTAPFGEVIVSPGGKE